MKFSNELSPVLGKLWSYNYFRINKIKSSKYITEPFFYNKLEKNRNDFKLAYFFEHKGYLDKVLVSGSIPSLYSRFNGIIYDSKSNFVCKEEMVRRLKELNQDIVVKRAVGTGGGKDVYIGTFKEIDNDVNLLFNSKHDFVVQECLDQHRDLAKFNPTSINTIRVLTFRVGNKIHIVSMVFRMGNGQRVDNSASGGISCGVDKNTGVLNRFALDHDFNIFNAHPYSLISFDKNHVIPFFSDVKDSVIANHEVIKNHDLISWDVTVADNGTISIIEFNTCWSELNFHQANNGPVFESFIPYIRDVINDNC
ncbi:sugar-transfer associated ATP-grasp domain-containing protein [Vibrio sp. 1287]|nr:sugar-transfer associated ATP-grasp domain-containing protein [Vibrio sp. 1287]MDW2244601.1 sugar-transfer associated ATP-grasp domain-containing protein [Vibrio sp. 1287]